MKSHSNVKPTIDRTHLISICTCRKYRSIGNPISLLFLSKRYDLGKMEEQKLLKLQVERGEDFKHHIDDAFIYITYLDVATLTCITFNVYWNYHLLYSGVLIVHDNVTQYNNNNNNNQC